MEEQHEPIKQDTYILGRDAIASVRLNLQHYYWRESLGFNLHPDIPIDKPDLAVADVATGTGIWILELSTRLPPYANLVGLDVSPDQFPHRSWTPSNVHFHVDDASSGLARPELRGAFDVVHVRLLMLMPKNNDPSPYIRYCLSLLKPGGYLQWGEYDNYSSSVALASPECTDEHLPKMLFRMATFESLAWIPDLGRHFLKEGMDVVSFARYAPPDHHLKGFTETLCIGHLEFADMLRARGELEKEAEVREGVRTAMEELSKGTCLRLAMQVVVGRKPESDKTTIWSGMKESLDRHADS